MSTDPIRPACTREDATAVVRRLRESGHVAYFAGGCVRDLLLVREPKDYDVATDAPPPRVRQLFRNTQAVGAAFGVILVRLGGSVIEVATFRSDGTYSDGRRPDSVVFSTPEQDAQRRDFTINGLFMDPLDGDKVIDHVGGQADLAAKVIRAIGDPDERFAEDHLRLLRAVRFAARLGFDIEPGTLEAIERHAGELQRIAPERIADELRRMFAPQTDRHYAYHLLLGSGLAAQVFRHLPVDGDHPPDADPLTGGGFMYDPQAFATFGGTLALLALGWRWRRAGKKWDADFRVWLSKAEVARVVRSMRQGLKISNDEAADLEGTLAGVGLMLADPEPTVAGKKRFLATPTAASAIDLMRAMAAIGLHADRIDRLDSELIELAKTDVAPLPLVTGDDLTAAGATPGPMFKRALDAAYDAQLEDRVTDKAGALALALSVMRD